jgi:hypothetical protein
MRWFKQGDTYNEDRSTCVVHDVTNLLGVKEGKGMSQSLTLKLLSWFIAFLAALLAGVGLIFLALFCRRLFFSCGHLVRYPLARAAQGEANPLSC